MSSNCIYELQTGDLVLFSGNEILSNAIQLVTDSKYTHVGMVVVVDKEHPLNGLENGSYLLEALSDQDVEDAELEEKTNGVQLTRLNERINKYEGNVYCRRLDIDRDKQFWEKLNHVYDLIRGVPFNSSPIDWAATGFFPELQKNNIPDKFFCSALIGFMYIHLGIFQTYTEWSGFRPKDFGQESGNRYPLMKKGYLGPIQMLKLYDAKFSKKRRFMWCGGCVIS